MTIQNILDEFRNKEFAGIGSLNSQVMEMIQASIEDLVREQIKELEDIIEEYRDLNFGCSDCISEDYEKGINTAIAQLKEIIKT